MKRIWLIALVGALSLGVQAQELERKFFVFHPFRLKSSMRHELGITIGSHFAKSPMRAKAYQVQNGVAYPEPVFGRTVGIFTLSYEPRFRLMEFGSNASITIDVPLVGSFSLGDVLTGSGERYSAEPLTDNQITSGVFGESRSNLLGAFHYEVGGLVSFNIFQGATRENVRLTGLTIGGGINYIQSPLVMNLRQNYDRALYSEFMRWTTAVGRVGFHIRGVSLYYMFGVNPTIVSYRTPYGTDETERVNTYNRFSIAFRLGR